MIISLENETNKMYEKNMKLLSPWIREAMLKIDEKTLWDKIKVTYNSDNFPICCYKKDNEYFHITSDQPIKEADIWYKSIKKNGPGSVFLYGCGFGYPLFEVFSHKLQHTLIVVFEQDMYLFKAMLYYFDLEPIIKTNKIAFLIGNTDYFAEAFNQLFYTIAYINCTYPTLAFTYTSIRNFKNEYLKIHKYIFSQLGLLAFYMGNDHTDNLLGFQNLIFNTSEILKNPGIQCLKNKFEGYPAFIISNGPSLDKNIHELNNIQDKGLIISTESAILPLMRNNIKADILTAVERTQFTYQCHFKDISYPEDLALICLALVDKHVLPSFGGEKVPVFRGAEAINKWVNESIGDSIGIDAGANVAHLALELAAYLGADPIVFVGQNYAYGADGCTHSKASVYFDKKGEQARKIVEGMPVVYVESNEGTMIASNQLWKDFKLGLEKKIFAHKDKTFFNATEGGAKIQGTACKPLQSIISQYCTKSIPRRVNELIAESKVSISTEQKSKRLKSFIENIEYHSELFRELASESNLRRLKCKEMIGLSLKSDNYKYRDWLDKEYENNTKMYYRFIPDIISRSFSQQIIFIYFYMINRLGVIDSPEKITEIFKIHYNFFGHLNSISQSVSVHLDNAADFLYSILDNIEKQEKEEGEAL